VCLPGTVEVGIGGQAVIKIDMAVIVGVAMDKNREE
jgi:hypothetical protein